MTQTRSSDVGDDAHVVGDEQHRGAVLLLQFADQLQDLLLRRDVERRGRLVGDQQLGLQDQRHGDHDALALAAGELVRIGAVNALDVGQLHLGEHVEDARLRWSREGVSVCALSTSRIWRPTVSTGLSAVIGSWKIIAILLARSARMRPRVAASRSSPSSRILPPEPRPARHSAAAP